MTRLSKAIAAPFAAAFVSFAIAACGQLLWGLLAIANIRFHPALPWAAPTMALLLAALLLYLAGFGPPASTKLARRRLLRWNPIPADMFAWAVLAGVLALVAFCGLWIAVSDVIHIPPGITPSMRGVPWATALSFLVMATLAAPLSEEAAFRGYAMGMLEKAWGSAAAAIVVSSLLFALEHVTQGFALPKLGLYFTAGLIFAMVAYLTNSLYAAMIVHSIGDWLGFLILWPHDAPHALVTEGGHDALFAPAVATLVIFTPLAAWAFSRLAKMRNRDRRADIREAALA